MILMVVKEVDAVAFDAFERICDAVMSWVEQNKMADEKE